MRGNNSQPAAGPAHPGSLPERAHAQELRILIILSALMSFASISTDMYLPALPQLVHDLNTDMTQIELTISTFLIGFSLGQLFWGPASDRYGRRLPIMIGIGLFILGSVGCALAETAPQMLVWRVIQALGACAGPVLARAMVRDLYARERAAQMLSTLILMMAVAPLLGPLLGGQLLLYWSWRGIFWVLAIMGVVALIAMRYLPETLTPARRSQASLAVTMKDYAALTMDRRLLRYALAGGFYYGGCYAFIAGTPFAYVDYYQVSAQAYGLLFGANILGLMVLNFVNTRLVAKWGPERLFRYGAWAAAASALWLALDAWWGLGGVAGLAIPIFCYMSVSGFIVANSVASALALFPKQAGAVSSLVGAMHYGSGVFSAALLGWCTDGTPWTMGWIVAVGGVGCLVFALWRSTEPEVSCEPMSQPEPVR